MKALIMAGGKGSRLRPLTNYIPKPLVKIIDKPVMECILDLLKIHGITEVGVTLGYKGDKIKEFFGNGKQFGVNITYFEEREPLGTAGGVKNASAFINDKVLVISGDAYTDMNLTELIDFHNKKNALATMALYKTEDARGFGLVETARNGKVLSFKEKPSVKCPGKVNTGVYVLEKKLIDGLPEGFCDFGKDVFPTLENLYGKEVKGFWSDIGTLQSYYLVNLMVAKRLENVKTDIAA